MKRSRFGNWLLGVMVAGGLAVLVMLAAMLLSMWLSQREAVAQQRAMKSWSYQQLVALQTGEVVVQTTTQNPQPLVGESGQTVTFTTPQGEPVPVTEEMPVAKGQHCELESRDDQSLIRMVSTLTGDWRIEHQTPGRLPPESRVTAVNVETGETWFFVIPNRLDEPCYFAGYRWTGRLTEPLGFIGARGLMKTKPTCDEGFQWIDSESGQTGRMLGTGNFYSVHPMQTLFSWDESNNAQHRSVIVWEGDRRRLFEINFARSGADAVQLVRDFGDDRPVSLKLHQEQARYGSDGRLNPTEPPQGFIRFNDRVEFVGPNWKATHTLQLPKLLRDKAVTLYETDMGPIAITYDESVSRTEGYVLVRAHWLTDNGEITKQIEWHDEPRKLAGDVVQLSWSRSVPQAMTLMPAIPLLSLADRVQLVRFNPLFDLSLNEKTKHGDYFLPSLRGWWDLLRREITAGDLVGWLICLLGGAASVAFFWKSDRSRDLHGLELAAWSGLIFLLGPAGLMGFLTHRPFSRHEA